MDTKKKIMTAIIAAEAVIIAGAAAFLLYSNSDAVKINRQMERAQQYRIAEDHVQALACYEAVLGIDPQNAQAYLGMAEAYAAENDLANAVRILEQGAERNGSGEVTRALQTYQAEIERQAQVQQKAVEAEAAAAQAAADASRMDSEEQEARALLEELRNQNPGYATEEQKTRLDEYAVKMEALIADGGFDQLEAVADEWRQLAADASVKKTGYDVTIMQYDITEYPTIRLYLDVRDAGGGAVKELAPNMFYISERDAGTCDFLNRSIQKAVLLNENERLNINLLADTSGSMEGQSMQSAKNVMANFLNTVQFSAGDQVKLTPFNSDIDKSGYFTGDITALNSTIGSYTAYGQTKLYDSIIYGVQDVSGQEGAKCVIAFTDGMDVGSYNTAQDVVDVVSRYHIPVFIVRIGDSSTSGEDDSLRQIAQASGGSFKNLSQFNEDMSDFYDQIYRQIKEYYVVEYAEDPSEGMGRDKEIAVYVQKQGQGGEAVMGLNLGNEYFESLLGSYLRSYINDMNNHQYQELAKYVDDTVAEDDKYSIQWQMKKQVSGGFSNVTAETLMSYQITDFIVEDSSTIRLLTDESYDVIYDEVYGDLKNSTRTVAQDAVAYLQDYYGYTPDDSAKVRIWAMVNQKPEYILKQSPDGRWKFSRYAGAFTGSSEFYVYDVELTDW